MSYHLKDRSYRFWVICSNQDGRHRPFKIFVLLKVTYAFEHDIFRIVSPMSLNLKFIFILSRGRTLLILGHLLKARSLPSNFVNAISLELFHQSTSNLIYVIAPKGQTLLILVHLLKSRWPSSTLLNICTFKGNICL